MKPILCATFLNYIFIPTFSQILSSIRKSSNPERCREPIHETWRWLEREIRKLFRFQSPVTNLAPNLRHSFRPRFQPNSYKGTFLQDLSRMFMNSQIKKSTQNTTLPGGGKEFTLTGIQLVTGECNFVFMNQFHSSQTG